MKNFALTLVATVALAIPAFAGDDSKQKITVTRETDTGLNTHFLVPGQGKITRERLADQIERGLHPGYHIQNLPDGRRIPRSNPNSRTSDNLN